MTPIEIWLAGGSVAAVIFSLTAIVEWGRICREYPRESRLAADRQGGSDDLYVASQLIQDRNQRFDQDTIDASEHERAALAVRLVSTPTVLAQNEGPEIEGVMVFLDVMKHCRSDAFSGASDQSRYFVAA